MWLKYGVAPDRTLLTINDVPSGKTNLACPFCNSGLTAKKGKIKQHHFAHLSGKTCLRVQRGQLPSLPLYDNFHLKLSAQHYQLLKQLWREYGNNPHPIIHVPFTLQLKRLFEKIPDGYRFTPLGKIPVGGLSLSNFNQIQEPLILDKLSELSKRVAVASGISSVRWQEKLAELKIYQLQIQRILQLSLYFLEIKADGNIFHVISPEIFRSQSTMAPPTASRMEEMVPSSSPKPMEALSAPAPQASSTINLSPEPLIEPQAE